LTDGWHGAKLRVNLRENSMIMMRNWLGLGYLALLAPLGAGCGGGGGAAPLTEDTFCEQKAQKECQVTAKCGTATSACVVQRAAQCHIVAGMSKTPPRVFHPENVSKCVSQTATVYAKSVITPTDLAQMDDVCAYVFQGDSEAGCAVNYDCKGTKICDKNLCATKVMKNRGALCGNPGEICVAGSYCAVDSVSGALTCLAKGAMSAVCNAATPCLETLRCDATSGMCAPLRMPNEGCASSSECPAAAPYCDPYVGNKCDIGLSFAPTAVAACADYGGGSSSGTGGASGNDAAADAPSGG
jgi:hypothetical protein